MMLEHILFAATISLLAIIVINGVLLVLNHSIGDVIIACGCLILLIPFGLSFGYVRIYGVNK